MAEWLKDSLMFFVLMVPWVYLVWHNKQWSSVADDYIQIAIRTNKALEKIINENSKQRDSFIKLLQDIVDRIEIKK